MAAVERDLPGSLRRYGPLLDAVPDTHEFRVACAMLVGLRPLASRLPVEWGARLLQAMEQEVLGIFVPPVLVGMPRDPDFLPPLLKLMKGFVTPEGLQCIAKHGDARATPFLIAKLGRDTPHWDKLLEACRGVGDPALVPALRQWTEKQRTVGANGEWVGFIEVEKVIAELKLKAESTRITGKHLAYVPSKTPRSPKPREKVAALKHRKLPSLKQQRADLVALLATQSLDSKADVLIRDAWLMRATRVEEMALPLGGTRIGGLPDLPEGIAWPALGDRALSFVAQVRLSEVASNGVLPKAGLLSFFVLDEWSDGEKPGYLEKAVVLHTLELESLRRTAVPEGFQSRRDGTMEERRPFASCLVEWARTLRLDAKPLLTAAELKRFEKLEVPPVPLENQLLGSAELLLKLTSDPQAGMEWGDHDALDFYWQGDFEKVEPYCGD